jgi:hypothetical protein
MALTTTAQIKASIRATQSNPADLASAASVIELAFSDSLANGTSADQCDLAFSDTRTLAASATEDLDLAGTLAAALGGTAVFVEVVAVMVTADAANTNSVNVGNGTAPVIGGPFGAAGANLISLQPGAVFLWFSPKNPAVAVTATTADILKVANSSSGTGVTYSIVILGRSA